MTPEQHLKTVAEYLEGIESSKRFLEAVKLYFCYFATLDELGALYQRFGDDFRHPDSQDNLDAAADWFVDIGGVSLDKNVNPQGAVRPFVWDFNVLKMEFPDLMEKLWTPWVTYEKVDYSSARQLEGQGDPVYEIEWLEERGMISVDGLLISRSIQPVVVKDLHSEPIIVAMPFVSNEGFSSKFDIIPAMGGGCAFKALYMPGWLDINYADSVGIDNVDTAMLCTGKIVQDPETKEASIHRFTDTDYFNVSRTLSNGVVVPFVRKC